MLADVRYEILRCLAYRHYWEPFAGAHGVVNGDKCIQWELRCNGNCGTTALEWRDMFGVRLPGTQRQYSYTREYREATGHRQADYVRAIHDQQKALRARARRLA